MVGDINVDRVMGRLATAYAVASYSNCTLKKMRARIQEMLDIVEEEMDRRMVPKEVQDGRI